MFNARVLKEEDYLELVSWWTWWRFPSPLQELLPNNGTCRIMLSKEGINISAGFIYHTNSKMCWIEFVVSNPDYRESDRKEALLALINELGEIAKSQGYKVAYTNLKNASLINHFSDCQYVKGSVQTIEIVKIL
ncbi:hypothetical protein [Myroides odoratus]|uniref:N-acetyltransferase domain-containing protein n=1 Tax=Myroides odoratus TaxID=256 RepID=A0A378RNM3_MYROD|nr:hypothetical protein [Myroides odoratus]QQU04264.1 hypothetical protein I6I89_02990 [Myroides odoratus]STZ28318.1 Uncharacterised protein [Myroides odoratus]